MFETQINERDDFRHKNVRVRKLKGVDRPNDRQSDFIRNKSSRLDGGLEIITRLGLRRTAGPLPLL